MKLNAEEEISAPASHVFQHLCDADRLERLVRKRGGKISRTPQGPIQQGSHWDAEVPFRGTSRKLAFDLVKMEDSDLLDFQGSSEGLNLTVRVEVVALGPHTSRLSVVSEARPKTLSARLMIQSAKLARGMMLTRYRKRISDFAADIEKAHRTA